MTASVFSRPAIAFVLLGTLCLSWPMSMQRDGLAFHDTGGYLWHGWKVIDAGIALTGLADGVPPPGRVQGFDGDGKAVLLAGEESAPIAVADVEAGTGTGTGTGVPARAAPDDGPVRDALARAASTRSLPYSLFLYVSSRPFGLADTAMLQTALVLVLIWAVVRDAFVPARGRALCGCAAVALLTPLPFVASTAMPDVLGAVPILFAMLLVRGWDGLDGASRLTVTAIASFALLSHYGNIPLGLACTAVALVLRLAQGRRDPATLALAVAPLIMVMLFNGALSRAAYGDANVTPGRLPVLLARSIKDGPGLWYLQEHCATERYAICTLHGGRIPADVGKILWQGEGAYNQASPEVRARIREEELTIVARAFAEYPFAQIGRFLGNSLRQFASVGVGDVLLHDRSLDVVPEFGMRFERRRARGFLDAAGAVHRVTWFAGLVALVVLAASRARAASGRGIGRASGASGASGATGATGASGIGAVLVVLAVGLFVNAAIFGGLSAPSDRYQARVAWLVPMVLAWWYARRTGATLGSSARPVLSPP